MCGRFILKSISRVPFFLELTSLSLTSSKNRAKSESHDESYCSTEITMNGHS